MQIKPQSRDTSTQCENKPASALGWTKQSLLSTCMMTSQISCLPGIHNTFPPFEDQVHLPPDGKFTMNILTHMADPSETCDRPASQVGCNLLVQCLQSPSEQWASEMICNDATHQDIKFFPGAFKHCLAFFRPPAYLCLHWTVYEPSSESPPALLPVDEWELKPLPWYPSEAVWNHRCVVLPESTGTAAVTSFMANPPSIKR